MSVTDVTYKYLINTYKLIKSRVTLHVYIFTHTCIYCGKSSVTL